MDDLSGMDALHRIRQAYEDWCKPLCRELGMPQMAFDILLSLSMPPERCTARDINRQHGFKENILSVNINKLVSEGYLERCAVEGDRRKVRLALTEKAQPIVARGNRAVEEFNLLMREGVTPEELDIFFKCLCAAGENARKIQAVIPYRETHDEEHISAAYQQ